MPESSGPAFTSSASNETTSSGPASSGSGTGIEVSSPVSSAVASSTPVGGCSTVITSLSGNITVTTTASVPCGLSQKPQPSTVASPTASAPVSSGSEPTESPSNGPGAAGPTSGQICSTIITTSSGSDIVTVTSNIPCGGQSGSQSGTETPTGLVSSPTSPQYPASAGSTSGINSPENTEVSTPSVTASNSQSEPTGSTETSSESYTYGTVTRGSLTGPEVVTIATMSPSTTCPTSELTYMVLHGSSTLLEQPKASESMSGSIQEATINSQYLNSAPTSEVATASMKSRSDNAPQFESNAIPDVPSVSQTESVPMLSNKASKTSRHILLAIIMSMFVLII